MVSVPSPVKDAAKGGEVVKRHSLMCMVIAVMLIVGVFVGGYGLRSGGAADAGPVVATERWESITERGNGKGVWTLSKHSDGTLSIAGEWAYAGSVTCPFNEGSVTMAGPSFAFTAEGTATNASAPLGYQTSPFALKVEGETRGGKGSGTYAITFSAAAWPPGFSGKWTATRTEGEGITE